MELLERAAFLQTLGEYAGEAQRGTGRLVLVSGESGMGKTVLLEEFQHQLPEARWLWGGCDGLLTPRPLGPLFEIATQLNGEFAALCRNGAPRERLFTGFLAEIGPPAGFTVAVIEDVHWSDEATIDLLSFLGRRLGRMPALLLASYRDDEIAADHPLRLVLGDLATQRATRRMKLPPLSVDAVRELVGQRDVDAAELHRITGGNPFYVSETLEAGWPSVPPTVRDAVGARLALEWVFTSIPKNPPLPNATFGFFPAACHYVDGTFVPEPSKADCPTTAPGTGAAFFFWHPKLYTMHFWVWYPNPAGLYSGMNPLVAPFNGG